MHKEPQPNEQQGQRELWSCPEQPGLPKARTISLWSALSDMDKVTSFVHLVNEWDASWYRPWVWDDVWNSWPPELLIILSLPGKRLGPRGSKCWRDGNNRKFKKAKEKKLITLCKVPRTQGLSSSTETFVFYSLFLFIFLVRKKIHVIIKSQTQQKLIKQR